MTISSTSLRGVWVTRAMTFRLAAMPDAISLKPGARRMTCTTELNRYHYRLEKERYKLGLHLLSGFHPFVSLTQPHGIVHADILRINMRTLLHHIPTGQYFQSLEKWTSSPKEAHDFKFMGRVLRFVTRAGFSDMEVILSLDKCKRGTGFSFGSLLSHFSN